MVSAGQRAAPRPERPDLVGSDLFISPLIWQGGDVLNLSEARCFASSPPHPFYFFLCQVSEAVFCQAWSHSFPDRKTRSRAGSRGDNTQQASQRLSQHAVGVHRSARRAALHSARGMPRASRCSSACSSRCSSRCRPAVAARPAKSSLRAPPRPAAPRSAAPETPAHWPC